MRQLIQSYVYIYPAIQANIYYTGQAERRTRLDPCESLATFVSYDGTGTCSY